MEAGATATVSHYSSVCKMDDYLVDDCNGHYWRKDVDSMVACMFCERPAQEYVELRNNQGNEVDTLVSLSVPVCVRCDAKLRSSEWLNFQGREARFRFAGTTEGIFADKSVYEMIERRRVTDRYNG